MTKTRIDHTGHGHDATPAARAACRKALAATPARELAPADTRCAASDCGRNAEIMVTSAEYWNRPGKVGPSRAMCKGCASLKGVHA